MVQVRLFMVSDGKWGWEDCGGSWACEVLEEGARSAEGTGLKSVILALGPELRENMAMPKQWRCNLDSEGGIRPSGWCPDLHPTGEQNFIKSLINFDKDNISDKVLKKIGAYCAQPDFQPDIIGRVSLAAKSLCMWVRAMEVSRGGVGWGGEQGSRPGKRGMHTGESWGNGRPRWEGRDHWWVSGWVGYPTAWPSPCRCTGGCIGWWSPSGSEWMLHWLSFRRSKQRWRRPRRSCGRWASCQSLLLWSLSWFQGCFITIHLSPSHSFPLSLPVCLPLYALLDGLPLAKKAKPTAEGYKGTEGTVLWGVLAKTDLGVACLCHCLEHGPWDINWWNLCGKLVFAGKGDAE